MIQIRKIKENKQVDLIEVLPLLKDVQKEFNIKLAVTGSLFYRTEGNDVDLIAWVGNRDYNKVQSIALDIIYYMKDQESFNIGSGIDLFIPFQDSWVDDFFEDFNEEDIKTIPEYLVIQYGKMSGWHWGYWFKELQYDTVDNLYYELITVLKGID